MVSGYDRPCAGIVWRAVTAGSCIAWTFGSWIATSFFGHFDTIEPRGKCDGGLMPQNHKNLRTERGPLSDGDRRWIETLIKQAEVDAAYMLRWKDDPNSSLTRGMAERHVEMANYLRRLTGDLS